MNFPKRCPECDHISFFDKNDKCNNCGMISAPEKIEAMEDRYAIAHILASAFILISIIGMFYAGKNVYVGLMDFKVDESYASLSKIIFGGFGFFFGMLTISVVSVMLAIINIEKHARLSSYYLNEIRKRTKDGKEAE